MSFMEAVPGEETYDGFTPHADAVAMAGDLVAYADWCVAQSQDSGDDDYGR